MEAEDGAAASFGLKQVCKAGLNAGTFVQEWQRLSRHTDRVRYTLAVFGALQLHAGQG